MKTIIGIAAIVLLLAWAGWVSFSSTQEKSSLNLETQKIEQDTEELVESGKQIARDIEAEFKANGASVEGEQPAQPELPPNDEDPETITERNDL